MTKLKKSGKLFYIHIIIVVFFMFIFGQIVPPTGTITPLGMKILGIFMGMLYAR